MSEHEPMEKPWPGSEFTVMTPAGESVGGLLPVVGATVTVDALEEWTGVFVMPPEEDDR